MSRSDARSLTARFAFLPHCIRFLLQPERPWRSGGGAIDEHRDAMVQHLAKNPGRKADEAEREGKAWRSARRTASIAIDIAIDVTPAEPSFAPEGAEHPTCWPIEGDASAR